MKQNIKNNNIPMPSLERLLNIYRFCEYLEEKEIYSVSSSRLARVFGYSADSIRKDISFLGWIGNFGAGYDVKKLKNAIYEKLRLNTIRRVCIIGLGRLGNAILNYNELIEKGFMIVAGFDSNINKLETIKTNVELFPAYEIKDVVKRKAIEIGIIAVPAEYAQETANRLIEGGIRGIINFAPIALKVPENVILKNIDLLAECMLMSILLNNDNK
jgi:redox-sensing transcriptional repressor